MNVIKRESIGLSTVILRAHRPMNACLLCLSAEKKMLPRDDNSAPERVTSSEPVKSTNTIRDVTVTSSRSSSSSSSAAVKTTKTAGSMLIRRRGLASTPLPAVLRIALAPPTVDRSLHILAETPPSSSAVDTAAAAVNLTTTPGVGHISTAWSTVSSTKHRSVKTTAVFTPTEYSAVLSVTDLIGTLSSLLSIQCLCYCVNLCAC